MEPKISVIIPMWEVKDFLERCLDSVVNQTLKELEIICVDDGSSDDSLEIAKKYASKDERIQVIHRDHSSGPGAARNIGLDRARGKYIGFVDSDDWIDLDFYEKLYNAAEKHNADAACSGIKRPHKDGRTPIKLKVEKEEVMTSTSEKYRKLELPRRCYIWNKIYRRDELERQKLRFPEGMLFEDIEFVSKYIYFCKTVVTVPDVYYHYWANNKSITRDMRDRNQKDIITARANFIKFSREHFIICDEKFYIRNKVTYKFFGIPVLRIYEWETIKKYYLFGLIPFFEKRVSL